MDFQTLILTLEDYWRGRGCLLVQPYDLEVGAGPFSGPTPAGRLTFSRPAGRPTAVTGRTPTAFTSTTSTR